MKKFFLLAGLLTTLMCSAQHKDLTITHTLIHIKNNTGDTIILDMPHIGIHMDTLIKNAFKGPYRCELIMKGQEPFCVKLPGSLKWTQCTAGDDPRTTPFLAVASYVLELNYEPKKKLYTITFNKVDE